VTVAVVGSLTVSDEILASCDSSGEFGVGCSESGIQDVDCNSGSVGISWNVVCVVQWGGIDLIESIESPEGSNSSRNVDSSSVNGFDVENVLLHGGKGYGAIDEDVLGTLHHEDSKIIVLLGDLPLLLRFGVEIVHNLLKRSLSSILQDETPVTRFGVWNIIVCEDLWVQLDVLFETCSRGVLCSVLFQSQSKTDGQSSCYDNRKGSDSSDDDDLLSTTGRGFHSLSLIVLEKE
jgi:hypothetical protein